MGVVYRAIDQASDRELALKMLVSRRRGRHDVPRMLRFRREFHTLAQLRHPRIVEAFDYGIADGTPYYTMELLDGRDLRAIAPAPYVDACRHMRDVAAALAFLHSRKLVHRDLATRNVRCTADDRAKLIDFGLLATVGTSESAAGTAPFVAPETLRGLPLDARTDLFGLGALLYWLLTGQHAYPAQRFDQLPDLWRARPSPPSHRKEDVPPALDELVMSLLSLDRLARPSTAAEVIDRLGAIGRLDPEPDIESARGYLVTGAFVGREPQLKRLRERLAQTIAKQGRAIIVEGPTGMGKTRLLTELGLEAQLRGAVVVSVTSESAGRGPYAMIRAIARGLITVHRDRATRAAVPHAGAVVRIVPELGEKLGLKRPPRPSRDPNEERLRLQAALVDWLLGCAADQPLVLIVDDAQRCDEASAAVLASLAHSAPQHRLLVVTALRSDESVRAPDAIAAIRDAGEAMRLRGLTASDLRELVQATFGDVPHGEALARWLHRVAGGTPLYCTELLRHLVDLGVVRYLDGTWAVPENYAQITPPEGLAAALDTRVATLSATARGLAEALSVHGGTIPLELCVELGERAGDDAGKVFSALDELVREEILIGSAETYHFRHDGVREALLRGLDAERTRELHLRVGETLAASVGESVERTAEVGWHLLHGGESRRGAALLEKAGRQLYESQSSADAIAPLEAALEVLEREGASPARKLNLVRMLVLAGTTGDRDATLRHAPLALDGLARYSGVALAAKLGPWLGRHLALLIGLAWASLAWLVTPPRRRGPGPITSLQSLFLITMCASAVYAQSLEVAAFQALLGRIRPAAVFRNRIPYAMYLVAENLLLLLRAEFGALRHNVEQIVQIMRSDRLTPMSEIERQSAEGAAWCMRSLAAVSAQDPHFVDDLAQAEHLGLRFYELNAVQAHVAYHRSRGEQEEAAPWEARAEMLAVQLGSVQQFRAWLTGVSSLAYGFTRDVLGLKRCIEDLYRLTQEGYRYEAPLELTRGEYYRERGELDASRDALERCLEIVPEELNLVRQPALAALAETLLAAGDLERAREVAERAVALATDARVGMIANALRSMRALALIEAAAGDIDGAVRRLDEAIERGAPLESPSLCGALHEARARLALAQEDQAAYLWHTREANRLFRTSNNPVLIARGERLADVREIAQAEQARIRIVSTDAVTFADRPSDRRFTDLLSGCRGVAERAEKTLAMIVEAASGSCGWLYLLRDGQLELRAPLTGREAPDEHVLSLEAAIDERRQAGAGTASTVMVRTIALDATRIRTVVLSEPNESSIVGGAIIEGSALELIAPDERLVEQLAHELVEAGDVSRQHAARG